MRKDRLRDGTIAVQNGPGEGRKHVMINKVLIATDGSDHGNKAVEFGSDIAAKYGAGLVLVHILLRAEAADVVRRIAKSENLAAGGSTPPGGSALNPEIFVPTDLSTEAGNGTAYMRALEVIGEQILGEAEIKAKKHGVTTITKRLDDGDPVKRILDIAKAEGVDVIVTGARGLSDFQALLVGSVSHKLAHLSPITCISVR